MQYIRLLARIKFFVDDYHLYYVFSGRGGERIFFSDPSNEHGVVSRGKNYTEPYCVQIKQQAGQHNVIYLCRDFKKFQQQLNIDFYYRRAMHA